MKKNDKQKQRMNIILLIFSCLAAAVLMYAINTSDDKLPDSMWLNNALRGTERISYNEYKSLLDNEEIVEIWYSPTQQDMVVLINSLDRLANKEYNNFKPAPSKSDFDTDGYMFKTSYPAGEDFREEVLSKGVNLHYIISENSNALEIVQLISLLFPMIGLLLFMMVGAKALKPDNLKADDLIQVSNVKLEDIIGLDEIMDDINLVIKLIKNPEYGEDIGAKTPKGILLSGSPGVGKTMISQAISYETGLPFISVSGADFKELYVGNGARRVREVFKVAREKAPCIVFIDELDAIGEKRSSIKSQSEDTQTINALLKEMDGFKKNTGVFVLAATNYPDKLDPAITRAGRFDREIKIHPPKSWKVRKKLFELYLKDKKVGDDVDLDTLSRQVASFTGADIAAVCNEAALVALSKDLEYITHDCIEDAIDRCVFKGSRSREEVNPKDKQVVAYHEASHAIASILTNQPVARISIQSTTSGVGGAVMREEGNSCFKTKKDFEDLVVICYAGRVGEAIKFKSVTTGASNDIMKATEIIDEYVNLYGFAEDGVAINKPVLVNRYQTVNVQDGLIKKVSEDLYKRCYDLISNNFEMVERLAEKLLTVEKMTGKQVYEFLGIEPITE